MPRQHPTAARKPLKIATRGSALALWQAKAVQARLHSLGYPAELEVVRTEGDRVQNCPLHTLGGKGVFIREIERCLLAGGADLAVHSLKDLPVRLPPDFELAAVLPRAAATDTLILHPEFAKGLKPLPPVLTPEHLKAWGSFTVATGSLRRRCLLEVAHPDLRVIPIRGNVDSRVERLQAGEWDALVLAQAGLERLAIRDLRTCQLAPNWFVPSAAQGAVVVEVLKSSPHREACARLNCSQTYHQVSLERKVLELLGGDCTLPIGIHSWQAAGEVHLEAVVLSQNGLWAQASCHWPQGYPDLDQRTCAQQLLSTLVARGVNPVLADLQLPLVDDPKKP